eukprot:8412247-Alexandrium_andersonii.AAC.1
MLAAAPPKTLHDANAEAHAHAGAKWRFGPRNLKRRATLRISPRGTSRAAAEPRVVGALEKSFG